MTDKTEQDVLVDNLGLSPVVVHSLKVHQIFSTRNLVQRSTGSIAALPLGDGDSWRSLGAEGLMEIREALQKIDLFLRDDWNSENWRCRGCTAVLLHASHPIPFICPDCCSVLSKQKNLHEFFKVMLDKAHEDAVFTVAQAEVEYRSNAQKRIMRDTWEKLQKRKEKEELSRKRREEYLNMLAERKI